MSPASTFRKQLMEARRSPELSVDVSTERVRYEWVIALVVCVLCAAYARWRLAYHWIGHDEGTLAQPAVRILAGQVPHRDFDEVYTGGLSYLNAAAFQVLGTTLLSLRVALWAVYVLWLPVVYWIARQFTGVPGAVLATLLAAVWTVPVYPAAMPSWYNLFLATFGIAALIKSEQGRAGAWRFVAGLAGGVSCLVKIVGLYYLAGALLYLLYLEQEHRQARVPALTPRLNPYSAAISLCLLLVVVAVVIMLSRHIGLSEAYFFVVPPAFIVALLMQRERRLAGVSCLSRLRRLAGIAWPFVAGAAVPVLAFCTYYYAVGGLSQLAMGTLVTPMRRLSSAVRPPPSLAVVGLVLPHAVLLGMLPRLRVGRSFAPGLFAGLGIFLSVLCFLLPPRPALAITWLTLVPVSTLVTVAIVMSLWRGGASRGSESRHFLLASVIAFSVLIQFPYAVATYFAYIGPIVLFGYIAVAELRQVPVRATATAGLVYLLLGVAVVDQYHVPVMRAYKPGEVLVPLPGRGGGLRVRSDEAREYEALLPLVRRHAEDRAIYAAPDSPEVYFLSGHPNPTRELFDFFADSAGRTARLLRAIDSAGVRTVVINERAEFSGRMEPTLRAELDARFPHADSVGRFTVRWR